MRKYVTGEENAWVFVNNNYLHGHVVTRAEDVTSLYACASLVQCTRHIHTTETCCMLH